MKHFFKTVGSLFMDQFICSIGATMMILCVAIFFKYSLTGFLLTAAATIIMFLYTTYRSGFKSGFHDPHRSAKKASYYGYIYKGFLAGLLSALPLLVLYVLYLYTQSEKVYFGFWLANMYWTFPLSGAFPNHRLLVMSLVFLPMVLVPWIGYIAGYKNFLFSDVAMRLYKKITEHLPEE